MRAMLALFGALALAVSLPAVPAAAMQQAAVPAYGEDAYTLAQTIRPLSVTRQQLSDPAFVSSMRAMLLAEPDGAALETQYPGIMTYVAGRMAAVQTEIVIGELPEFWAQIAVLLDANLTAEEIAECTAFYASPVGRNALSAASLNFDYAEINSALDDDSFDTEEAARIRQSGLPAAYASLSEADRRALAEFALSPAGSKLIALLPQVTQLEVAFANSPVDPEDEAAVAAAITRGIDEYIAAGGRPPEQAQ